MAQNLGVDAECTEVGALTQRQLVLCFSSGIVWFGLVLVAKSSNFLNSLSFNENV